MNHKLFLNIMITISFMFVTIPCHASDSSSATVQTTDGNTLELNKLRYAYSESHSAPGYIMGAPSVTGWHSDMEHFPVKVFCGTVFVPMHSIASIQKIGQKKYGAYGDTIIKIRLSLKTSEKLEGYLGFFATRGRTLNQELITGEGAFGRTEIKLANIAMITFTEHSDSSKTFRPPKGKPGGPFLVSNGREKLTLSRILSPVKFSDIRNRFNETDLAVSKGMKFNPNFAQIQSIKIVATGPMDTHPYRVPTCIEIISKEGNRIKGCKKAGEQHSDYGLLGICKFGIIHLPYYIPMEINRVSNQ